MARFLVYRDVLTPFQAGVILRGLSIDMVMGQYQILDKLGHGGMGTVYLARHQPTKGLFAIKLIKADRKSSRNVNRFLREFEVSRRVTHPNIAKTYELADADGQHFMVLEFVPGPTLYRLIKKSGPAPPFWVLKWTQRIADALDDAHQLGIVHRDLKPSNVMIMPGGEPKLLDLGLARWFRDDHHEDNVTGKGRIVGSFDYMAPEQTLNSATADARSDIYGLGCVLYFALTGRKPFGHLESRQEKMDAHRRLAPVPMKELRPELPREIRVLVTRMLQKNPKDRFQTAAELRDIARELWIGMKPVPLPDIDLKPDRRDMTFLMTADSEVPSTDEPVALVETDHSLNLTEEGDITTQQESNDQSGSAHQPDRSPRNQFLSSNDGLASGAKTVDVVCSNNSAFEVRECNWQDQCDRPLLSRP